MYEHELKQEGGSGLEGIQLMPRTIGHECWKYWRNFELTKAIATALAESLGYLGAWHDNEDDKGNVLSRDCGLFQINIPVAEIGSSQESDLRTESLDPLVYQPVFHTNVQVAKSLYDEPDIPVRENRLWEPWASYTAGWATFPEWWIWHQDANGNPVGPWIPTGRYIQKAIAGQMNMHILLLKDWTAKDALHYAERYCEHFQVENTLYENEEGFLTWRVPKKPTKPPADGVGPRPVPNNGV